MFEKGAIMSKLINWEEAMNKIRQLHKEKEEAENELDAIEQLLSYRHPGWNPTKTHSENIECALVYLESRLELADIRTLDE